MEWKDIDFEPVARQVYDAFLVACPDVAVEGLFRLGNECFILCAALDSVRADGRTVRDWFENSLKPLAMRVELVSTRPPASVEVPMRSRAELVDGFGIVQSRRDVERIIALHLSSTFPFGDLTVVDRTLFVRVHRELVPSELRDLERVLELSGNALPFTVQVQASAATTWQRLPGGGGLELAPARFLSSDHSGPVRRALEDDEAFWREHYREVFAGKLSVETALDRPRFERGGACLVGTIFPTHNLRAYLSLYSTVVLVMPLADNVEATLKSLGVTNLGVRFCDSSRGATSHSLSLSRSNATTRRSWLRSSMHRDRQSSFRAVSALRRYSNKFTPIHFSRFRAPLLNGE